MRGTSGRQVKEERNRLQRVRDDEVDVGHRGSGHSVAASGGGGSPRLSSLLHALDGGAHRIKAWPCAAYPHPFVRFCVRSRCSACEAIRAPLHAALRSALGGAQQQWHSQVCSS